MSSLARMSKKRSYARKPAQGPRPPAAAGPSRRGYAGMTPEELDQERRRRLLDTALELFAKQGYAHTSIEQLCAQSRVTARYFYQLFSSREALLRALYDEIIARTRAATLAALSQPGQDPQARISGAIAAFVQAYVQDPRCARVCVLEAVGVSAQMEKHRRDTIHAFAAVIEGFARHLAETGLLPKRDYHLLSVALVGGTNELLAEWLTVEQPPSIDTLTQEIQLLFRAAIRGGIELLREAPADREGE
jgi:AcrR family transcriptional regulator